MSFPFLLLLDLFFLFCFCWAEVMFPRTVSSSSGESGHTASADTDVFPPFEDADNDADVAPPLCEATRVMACPDGVWCAAVHSDGALWIDERGCVQLWPRRAALPTVLVEFGQRPPALVVIMAEQRVVLVWPQEARLCDLHCETAADLTSPAGRAESSYFLSDVWRVPCALCEPRHATAASDGSAVAICSSNALTVLDVSDDGVSTSVGAATDVCGEGDGLPHSCTSASTERPDARLLSVDCADWFGECGCTRACFGTSDRLYVVSGANHLVAVTPDWRRRSLTLLRDGHVLSRTLQVSCLAASSGRDALLVVAFSDGSLRLLEMETLDVFRSLNLGVLMERVLRSREPQQPAASTTTTDVPHVTIRDVAVGTTHFTVGVANAVVYVDKETLELCPSRTAVFSDAEGCVGGREAVSVVGDTTVRCTADGSWIAFLPAAEELIYGVPPPVVQLPLNMTPAAAGPQDAAHSLGTRAAFAQHAHYATPQGEEDLVHATQPLPPAWLAPFPPAEKEASRNARNRDKPVTFGHPIRSSGYAAAPWSVQQTQQKKAAQRAKAASKRVGGAGAGPGESRRCQLLFPYDQHRFVAMPFTQRSAEEGPRRLSSSTRVVGALTDKKVTAATAAVAVPRMAAIGAVPHRAAVLGVAFDAVGEVLLTAGGDGEVHATVYHATPSKGTVKAATSSLTAGPFPLTLHDHRGPVSSVDTSLSVKELLVLSAGGSDGTLKLWRPKSREAPYLSYSVESTQDVRQARFFYVDKFIAYAAGNTFALHHYAVDRDGGGELHRGRNDSTLSAPLFQYPLPCHTITAMECINHFSSSLVLLSGSNKELHVLDVSTQQTARTVENAHQRSIHHIAMCRGSRFAGDACSLTAQHLFVTAGLDNTVCLWDLRQAVPARRFTRHKNQSLPSVGLALSPTSAMVAVGSEDRRVYVYDVAMGGAPLDTLPCSETATSIVWHPTDPVMAVGLSSGEVCFFGQTRT